MTGEKPTRTQVEHCKFITRGMLKAAPEKLFVFGDNMIRKGYGGDQKRVRRNARLY